MTLKPLSLSSFWTLKSSGLLNAPAMAEFFVSAMMMLLSGGSTVRVACGSTTIRSVWTKVMPRLRAASACPSGTVLMPERTASQTNDEV